MLRRVCLFETSNQPCLNLLQRNKLWVVYAFHKDKA